MAPRALPATPFVPLRRHDPLPRRLCIPPVPGVPLQPALFPTLYHPSPPGHPTTQTREAIRRGLRVRHSDDRIRTSRGMSNNIRMATVTDDEAAARNSLAHFVFSSPPSCAGSGNMLLHPLRRPSPISTVPGLYQPHFQPAACPLSLIGFSPPSGLYQ